MLQVLAVHDAVPFVLLQTLPQAPQLDTLFDVLTSHPSE